MANSKFSLAAGNRWLFILFSLFWFVLVFFTYWGFHPYYSLSLGTGTNLDIALVLLILCAGAGFWLSKPNKKKQLRSYNGLALYGFLLLLQVVLMGIYGNQQQLFSNGLVAGIGYFIVFSILMHAAIFLIILIHYAWGHLLLKALAPWYNRGSHRLLSIAVGISLFGFVMLIIGQIGLLYAGVLWVLGLGMIAWQYKAVLDFLKAVLWKPYKRKESHPIWLVPPFLLLISIAVNAIGAIKVIPLGFDGSALYMNISRLIVDYNALPEGGQAYNWSVFMSLGQLLFGKISLSIMLSHFAGILAILVLYRLARLFMHSGAAWMVAAIFYLSPAVNFHLILDEKVDLGFLFITLSTLLLLVEYHVKLRSKKSVPESKVLFKTGNIQLNEGMVIWLIVGWLSGYAFGIKYTGIMSIFALLTYLVYQKAGTKAGIGMLAALAGILFLGGIYRFGYIELGNSSPIIIGVIALLIAAPFLYLGLKGQKATIRSIGFSMLLFVFGAGLAFAPWMGKHLNENRQISVNSLIQGKSPRPELSVGLPATQNATDPFQEAMKVVRRRGISLSGEQQQQLRNIISEYDFISAGTEQRIVYAKEIRNRVISELLTAQQITQAGINQLTGFTSGVGEGTELQGGKREEIKRYVGYEKGLPLFLSIPHDVTMNTNVRYLKYLDISFLFLLLIPLLMFSQRDRLAFPKNIVLIVTIMLIWIISVYSIYVNGGAPAGEVDIRNAAEQVIFKHNPVFQSLLSGIFISIQTTFAGIGRSLHGLYTSIAGFSFLFVFISIVALLALGYWLFRERLNQLSTNFKGVLAYTSAFAFFWLLLGSAIVWYAFPMFALLAMLLSYFLYQPTKAADESIANYTRYFLMGSVGIYFLLTTCLNFISTTEAEDNADMRYQKSFILYATSSMDEEAAFQDFNPFLQATIKKINSDLDGKVYRVGTYFNYHIRFNDERVYEDNQLELFGAFIEQKKNPREFLQILKENGFKYVLYDLYTPGLDNTPEQSLAQKANRFLKLLRSSSDATLLHTDNLVEAPQGQRDRIGRITLPGRLSLDGNIVQQGSFALFELQ